MITDLDKYSQKIRKDAEDLLKKTNLVEVLSEFGEVKIGGSFKYDLMWGPDIDMVVVCKNPREMSVNALNKIVELRLAQKFEYGDFVKFKRENRPESYIVNMILPFSDQKWEAEIWFFEEYPKSQAEMDELIKNNLNKENKEIILEMKRRRDSEGMNKYKINSAQIYKKVLIEGIKSFEELI